ncbi:kinesin-like protein KIN-7I isoform X2 [Leptopilina heterotoma]|uniref:kinesin-like protein KIN-7I isoform X2 n=1 Tax=Leptopilina heterotoma TaxID=63436 RepID=UPI001CA7B8C3|nr:kinesin-like protein KIN-7I isoform X2 [Leptopilina heterotoma]
MNDLIDLNSPDTSKVLRRELASPLIPIPAGIEKDDLTSIPNGLPNLLADEKRDNFDNNPFDKVLQETTEYVRKKEDPFELVLEKVKSSKNSKRNSIEFKDDFVPKHVKHANVLKLNKTLDDSVLDNSFNIYNFALDNNRINENLFSPNLLKGQNDVENVPKIFVEPSSPPLNSSALNYSAMNDSLIESNVSFKENEIRSLVAKRVSMCIQKGIMEAEGKLGNTNLLSKSRRCHSQGDRNLNSSSKNLNHKQRFCSTGNIKNKLCNSERSTLSSIEYDDQMNKAFLQEQSSIDNSVFTDISNISEITRLNSISSAYNSSLSFLSNGTMNQAFMESGSTSNSQILPTIVNVSKTVCNDISDLRNKFETLKLKLSHSCSDFEDVRKDMENAGNSKEFTLNDGIIIKEKIKNKKINDEEKLIDVEVFIPTNESKSSTSKDSITDTSSDSVFTKSSMNKSILSEARKIAKTFEEMADTDKSNSSGFDLLSNTEFNFDNLPDSDEEVEAVEMNLIDLPVSPLKTDVPVNSSNEANNENKELNETANEMKKIKEIEKEFTQSEDSDRKKIVVTSLLLELEKLIKTEKNPDAEKLLNDLEKVLGVKWENNADLLNVYLQNAKSNAQTVRDDIQGENTEIVNLETEEISETEKNLETEENLEAKRNLETEKNEEKDEENLENGNLKTEEIKENAKCVKQEENKSSGLTVKDSLMRKSSFVIKKGKSDFIKSFSKRIDSPLKIKGPIRKIVSENLSQDQVVKKTSQSPKGREQSLTAGARKKFSSDPCEFNSSFGSQSTSSSVPNMKKAISIKEVSDKVVTVTDVKKTTLSSSTSALKNKFKCKSESGVSKKGPMKATIPFGGLQRRGSFVKKVSSLSELETSTRTSPEKSSSLHVPTSTPNSSISSLFKKSKSKPVASSTPDSKEQKNSLKPKSPQGRKLSCNISPVSPFLRPNHEKLVSKDSPKRNASSPKRASTPKVQKSPRTPSAIPKFSSLPTLQRRKSMNDLNKSGKYSEVSRLSSSSNLQKTFGSANKSTSVLSKTPLRNSNKMDLKCKIAETR